MEFQPKSPEQVPEHLKVYSAAQTSSEENVALFEAALGGNLPKVKLFLGKGASPEVICDTECKYRQPALPEHYFNQAFFLTHSLG